MVAESIVVQYEEETNRRTTEGEGGRSVEEMSAFGLGLLRCSTVDAVNNLLATTSGVASSIIGGGGEYSYIRVLRY